MGDVISIHHHKVEAEHELFNAYIDEMKQLAEQGDGMAIDAISALNRMFPEEDPILYAKTVRSP